MPEVSYPDAALEEPNPGWWFGFALLVLPSGLPLSLFVLLVEAGSPLAGLVGPAVVLALSVALFAGVGRWFVRSARLA